MQADTLIQEYKVRGRPLEEVSRLDETDELISLLHLRRKYAGTPRVQPRKRL